MPMPLVPVKKRVRWTEYEHILFLHGLKKYGKGDWKRIANEFVLLKTPTQVASHAQKYYIQQKRKEEDKKRNSIHDITMDKLGQCMVPNHVNQLPPPQTNWGLSQQNQIHPQDVEIQHEMQQTQQVLDSKFTNNLPQQMGCYEIHDINPQSTDKYTLSDIWDLRPKNRNHPLNCDLPPQDLTLPPDVTIKQQQLQELQHALKRYLHYSYPQGNLPQQIDGYGILPLTGIAMQQAQQPFKEEFKQCMISQVTDNQYPLLPLEDLMNPIEEEMQKLPEYQQLHEFQQSQQVCIEGLNQCMVIPEVPNHHKNRIAPLRVHNFRELFQ